MKRILLLLIMFNLIAVFAFSQSALQTAATINLIRTEPITLGQLQTEVGNLERAMRRTLNEDERRQVLDAMINERLVMQAAERDRVNVSDNEVNQHLNELRSMLAQSMGRQPTDAEFEQAVRNETGMALAAYREQIRKQILSQKYLVLKKETLLNSFKLPTESEVRSEYELSRSSFVRPETVRFSMIQIPYGPDATSRARARETGDRLIREIASNPSRFDEVAARSVTPNSGYMAGDAGFLPRNQEARNIVGQQLMDAAFSLRQGQVSTLIEGLQGFHIIKITENYAQKNLELDDILQLGTRITVKDYITQMMAEHRQQAIIKQASEELISELRTGRSYQIILTNFNW